MTTWWVAKQRASLSGDPRGGTRCARQRYPRLEMTGATAPRPIEILARRLASEARIAGVPRGIPRFNSERDDIVRALPTFVPMVRALNAMPEVRAMYGPDGAEFKALEWVYAGRLTPRLSWKGFSRLLLSPTFRLWAISKLGGVALDGDRVRFGDGLSLVARSPRLLQRFSWWTADLDEIMLQEESGAGIIWTAMVHETNEPKSPGNMLLGSTGGYSDPMNRLLLALRLANDADIWSGPIYLGRQDRPIGRMSTIPSGPSYRPSKRPSAIHIEHTRSFYRALVAAQPRLDTNLGNLATAMRRFSRTFDRGSMQPEDQLVDDVTALEGSIGKAGPELKFTLAYRVSAMLEREDAGRVSMFRDLSDFYNVRSRIVHGSRLKSKEQALVAREPELRNIVRRLLTGLLATVGTSFDPTPDFLDNRLDDVLLAERTRRQLVTAMSKLP